MSRRRRRREAHALAGRLIGVAAVLLLVLTLAGEAASWHWALALFEHFAVQGALVALVLLVPWWVVRPRRPLVLGVLLACLVLHGARVAPLFGAHPPVPDGPRLRVLAFNSWVHNPATTTLWEYVTAVDADVTVFSETSPELLADADALEASHDIAQVGEFLVLLRRGLEAQVVRPPAVHHGVVVSVVHDGRPLTLVGVHAWPAFDEAEMGRTFTDLERVCAGSAAPVVVVGDLNATPWSHRVRGFLARTGLRDSSVGHGVQASFPFWPPVVGIPFRLPIDHGLHAPELACARRELGPALGSNHRPLVLELVWRDRPGP